jgi:uncharacterized membrane protein YraQ (UPF0718 family)
MSIFGAKVAVIYVALGLVIAVIGGTIIEKMHMEKYVESFILKAGNVDIESPDLTKKERLLYAKEQMLSTFKKVIPYILIGVGIGAVIHNWIPEDWVLLSSETRILRVILATVVGVRCMLTSSERFRSRRRFCPKVPSSAASCRS